MEKDSFRSLSYGVLLGTGVCPYVCAFNHFGYLLNTFDSIDVDHKPRKIGRFRWNVEQKYLGVILGQFRIVYDGYCEYSVLPNV